MFALVEIDSSGGSDRFPVESVLEGCQSRNSIIKLEKVNKLSKFR